MIKGYKYQSPFARYYYSLGFKRGLEEAREELFRRAVVDLLAARLPALRDELESRCRGQPVEWMGRMLAELYNECDLDRVRAVLATAPGPVRREEPDFSKARFDMVFEEDAPGSSRRT